MTAEQELQALVGRWGADEIRKALLSIGVTPQPRRVHEAVANLSYLADRWEQTTIWHDPPFLVGEIHISTGDLRDIADVVRWAQNTLAQHGTSS